jgi:hypothetical protein
MSSGDIDDEPYDAEAARREDEAVESSQDGRADARRVLAGLDPTGQGGDRHYAQSFTSTLASDGETLGELLETTCRAMMLAVRGGVMDPLGLASAKVFLRALEACDARMAWQASVDREKVHVEVLTRAQAFRLALVEALPRFTSGQPCQGTPGPGDIIRLGPGEGLQPEGWYLVHAVSEDNVFTWGLTVPVKVSRVVEVRR